MTGRTTLPGWGERLLGEARLALVGTPWAYLLLEEPVPPARVPEFSDESGNRRPIDALLIAWLQHTTTPSLPACESTDMRLWRLLLDSRRESMLEMVNPKSGPVTPEFNRLAIEVATETELAALHALSHAGDFAKSRVDSASDWIVQNLQPDNATSHPWAAHVFLFRAFETGSVEHRLYAETLLHNCIVSLGRADRFSALVLLDSGRTLKSSNRPRATNGSLS
ncbi:MAG: hypothetical protein KF691_09695 [Phycisphaeraceae bacterium]|nr:hypothetical protein [Phycisphaeraceae bacterium]